MLIISIQKTNTVLYYTILYYTLLYSTLLYSTLLYSTLPYPTKAAIEQQKKFIGDMEKYHTVQQNMKQKQLSEVEVHRTVLETEKIRKSDVVNTGETTIKKEHKSKFITLSQHKEVHSITTSCYKKACITDKACKLCLIN